MCEKEKIVQIVEINAYEINSLKHTIKLVKDLVGLIERDLYQGFELHCTQYEDLEALEGLIKKWECEP